MDSTFFLRGGTMSGTQFFSLVPVG